MTISLGSEYPISRHPHASPLFPPFYICCSAAAILFAIAATPRRTCRDDYEALPERAKAGLGKGQQQNLGTFWEWGCYTSSFDWRRGIGRGSQKVIVEGGSSGLGRHLALMHDAVDYVETGHELRRN